MFDDVKAILDEVCTARRPLTSERYCWLSAYSWIKPVCSKTWQYCFPHKRRNGENP